MVVYKFQAYDNLASVHQWNLISLSKYRFCRLFGEFKVSDIRLFLMITVENPNYPNALVSSAKNAQRCKYKFPGKNEKLVIKQILFFVEHHLGRKMFGQPHLQQKLIFWFNFSTFIYSWCFSSITFESSIQQHFFPGIQALSEFLGVCIRGRSGKLFAHIFYWLWFSKNLWKNCRCFHFSFPYWVILSAIGMAFGTVLLKNPFYSKEYMVQMWSVQAKTNCVHLKAFLKNIAWLAVIFVFHKESKKSTME